MATARITLTGRQFRPDDLSAGLLGGLFLRRLVPDENYTHPRDAAAFMPANPGALESPVMVGYGGYHPDR
jgi:hypothetical protein